ncbi:uncharacterized protein [Miscanthus floridulus]|uniref:uncharacterized protein isoform X2 n=1 Tax=Miscanthus floridulus TaxID=154761 RepID=UPI003458DE53
MVITGKVNVHPDSLPASAIRTSPSPPRPAAASSPSPSHPRRARPCRRLLAISPRARTWVRFPSPSTRSAGQPTTPAKLVTRPVLAPPPGRQGAGHQGAREGERDVRKPWSPDPPRWAASAATRSRRARGGSRGAAGREAAAAVPVPSLPRQRRRPHPAAAWTRSGGGTSRSSQEAAPTSEHQQQRPTRRQSRRRLPLPDRRHAACAPPLGRLPLPLPGQRRFLSLGASARGCGARPATADAGAPAPSTPVARPASEPRLLPCWLPRRAGRTPRRRACCHASSSLPRSGAPQFLCRRCLRLHRRRRGVHIGCLCK